MSMTKLYMAYVVFALLIVMPSGISAQENIAVGNWRTHFSHHNARLLAVGSGQVYVASANGLFIFDEADQSVYTLSKVDGLSGNDFTALHYHAASKSFVVAYQNGRFDIIHENGRIRRIDALANADLSTGKRINKVISRENTAYFLGPFGVLLFDMGTLRVIDEFSALGVNGQHININDGVFLDTWLFLATSEGVISGDFSSGQNLKDFRNWQRYGQSTPVENVVSVNVSEEKIIALFSSSGFYSYDGNAWNNLFIEDFDKTKGFQLYNEKLYLISSNSLRIFTLNGTSEGVINHAVFEQLNAIHISKEGKIYLTDERNGFLLQDNDMHFSSIFPKGPYSTSITSLRHFDQRLIVTINSPLQSATSAFSVFYEGKWQNYSADGWAGSEEIPDVGQLVDVQTINQHFYFLASDGSLLKWDGASQFDQLTMPSMQGFNSLTNYEERLYASNSNVNDAFFSYDESSNSWERISLSATNPNATIRKTDVSPEGVFYLLLSNGGIIIHRLADGSSRWLRDVNNEGGFTGNIVFSASQDLTGRLWLGSNNGAFYLRSPVTALSGNVNAFAPIFEGFFLLRGFNINAIATDGGDRKWMASNQGVWLFNNNGEEEVKFFNRNNSPIPSDSLTNISINHYNGEVFFLSARGLVSYRSDATAASLNPDKLRIFPNPVTLSTHDKVNVGGNGLHAEVKITDMSGKLIWRGRSQGGNFSWNLFDYQGNKARPGVYLVYSAQSDGEFGLSGKFVVIP